MLLLLTALLAWGILWARDKARDEVCRAIVVDVLNSTATPFVTPQAVKEELDSKGISAVGRPVWQINTDTIEAILRRSPYLEDAECFFMHDGTLRIRVSQLVPVLRVFDGNSSYYVNREGKYMRATATYHADVPVVHGHFTKQYPVTRLLPLIRWVERDSALKSLVTMYHFVDSNNIYFVPAIAGHVVNLGNATGYENKFKKLELFYRKVMPEKGWFTYDTISLKWNYQVVATKRHKKVEVVQEYNPEEDEQDDDHETMTVSDPVEGAKPAAKSPEAPAPAEKKEAPAAAAKKKEAPAAAKKKEAPPAKQKKTPAPPAKKTNNKN